MRIAFGALAPTIEKQLAEQGLEVSYPNHWENKRKAIGLLWMNGLLSPKEYDLICKRFMKKLALEVKPGRKSDETL